MTRIRIIAVGSRMPAWVQTGFEEYRKRMPREFAVELREISTARRSRTGDTARALAQEGAAMLHALAPDEFAVALEVGGEAWDTDQLAASLRDWMAEGRRIAFLIGGPDGLSQACRERAAKNWSLSRLTLPHPLVRIVLMEQLYRAWSILAAHPYHR
jgi:23S rRNA (pseudouridine1915-N3)-methyltransferase